jgi:hypothetical protein
MSGYGDSEPEDAWDPDDPIPVLIDNLLRRLDLLDRRPDLSRRGELVGELAERLAALAGRARSTRDQIRYDQLVEDLAWLEARAGG